jgi:hypothetical protein
MGSIGLAEVERTLTAAQAALSEPSLASHTA